MKEQILNKKGRIGCLGGLGIILGVIVLVILFNRSIPTPPKPTPATTDELSVQVVTEEKARVAAEEKAKAEAEKKARREAFDKKVARDLLEGSPGINAIEVDSSILFTVLAKVWFEGSPPAWSQRAYLRQITEALHIIYKKGVNVRGYEGDIKIGVAEYCLSSQTIKVKMYK